MMKTPLLLKLFLTILASEKIFSEVVINNNGYSGLVIAIHEDVPENKLLLESIKEMITLASAYLYGSTKHRAYFKQATIMVPSTWTVSSQYKPVPYFNYMNSAEVRIAPPNGSNIQPYTVQLGGCGERGQYIYIPSDFLLKNSSNKIQRLKKGVIFHHEWAHLRYGIFDEYGEKGNKKFPIFYKDNKPDKFRPNACSSNIVGIIRRSDGKSPCITDMNKNLIEDCNFYADSQTGIKNDTGKSSPMYMPELDSADKFCDSDSHNPSAPNMHNRMCSNRPTTEIILDNVDFKDGRNLPRVIQNITTEINVIQSRISTSKVVMVLDVSGSMGGKKSIAMQTATSRFIKYHIKDVCNISLGIVSFSSVSTILADLTSVTNSSKDGLIKKIPNVVGGYTAIGQGILKAIEVLSKDGDSIEKSKIILLTDGEENRPPFVKDISVFDKIKKTGVVIYTLAIGNQASKKLEEISKVTGAKAEFYDPDKEEKSMDLILNSIIIDIGCNDLLPIIIANRAIMIEKERDIEGFFHVDSDLGSTIVFMSYNYSKTNKYNGKTPIASISDPEWNMFTQESPEYTKDENLCSIQFKIPQAKPGKWKYRLHNPGHEDVHVNLMITSDKNNESNSKPIRVRSWVSEVNVTYPQVSKIFAEVTKDDQPVVRARVIATAYRPDGKEEMITLNDNGKGADTHANDGVYTEYFTRYSGSGRYAIDVNVENTADTRLNKGFDFSRLNAPVLPIAALDSESEEPRSEFLLTDLRQVNEVFESSAIYNGYTDSEPDYKSMDPVDDFERFDSAGTFLLNNWTPNDLIPPSRITDLTIVATNFSARTVHLQWTSTGDDMNDGQAASIELRYHHDLVFLIRSFEQSFSEFVILNGSLSPPKAYEIHSVILLLPKEESFSILNSSRLVHFAVRAIDKAKNSGQVSYAAIADFSNIENLHAIEDYMMYSIIAIAVSSVIMAILVIIVIIIIKSCSKKRNISDDGENDVIHTSRAQERISIILPSIQKRYGEFMYTLNETLNIH